MAQAKSWVFPWNLVIFQSYVNGYQRVSSIIPLISNNNHLSQYITYLSLPEGTILQCPCICYTDQNLLTINGPVRRRSNVAQHHETSGPTTSWCWSFAIIIHCPLVIQHNYRKSPFIVDVSIKHWTQWFCIAMLNYQRVYHIISHEIPSLSWGSPCKVVPPSDVNVGF